MMKIESSKDNIIFLKGDSQYDLAATFMRMQEYYESPKFKGKEIVLEEYMDWYAAEYGNFTYTVDWNGFNVPGNVVRKFFEVHQDILLQKEHKLFDLLAPWIEGKERFYVIGVHEMDNTLDHEFSHAFYYLDTSYKARQRVMLKDLPEEFITHVHAMLEKKGYHPSVFEDETIAYLATNTMADSVDMFKIQIPWNEIAPLQVDFTKRYDSHKGDDDDTEIR